MNAPTKEFETPISKTKVVIKDWITGKEREYINEPLYKINAQPKLVGGKADVQLGQVDMKEIMIESQHRELEMFIVSIEEKTEFEVNGKKIPAWEYALELPEEDTEFIKNQIEANSKKKETPAI